MGPMGRYVRTRLRRRLFWWFGGAIFMTVVSVAVTMAAISHFNGEGWWRDYERVHRQRVAAFPHVARIRTAFAMRAVVPRRGFAL